jgi:hypothetical protein
MGRHGAHNAETMGFDSPARYDEAASLEDPMIEWFEAMIAKVEQLVEEDDLTGYLRSGHHLWHIALQEVGDLLDWVPARQAA